ncbi:hypothetical protein TanjilG_12856 [Lupinus angustifolius]|uniref:BHLH domain-containing protein n=1 Tax=Lupinus angustifolius TaxID=3871 RepID=A0A1J7GQ20_LUPAN|nr:PREDICTED: transcription factor bHLH30-like [Lupinus angustifolius]OIW02542.1 hypothetical protein TanjilG_12856 [Lupinus angustifolius]
MLPFGRFYGLESWVDINPEPSRSLMKGMEMNDSRSKSERKSMEACKSHRDAERRRRQRINDHLTTLRSLLPNNTLKSDKASLLAEVVQHVKQLRKQADDVAHGDSYCSGNSEPCSVSSPAEDVEPWPFPGVFDEATVSYCDGEPNRMKVTLCCEDRPGLNQDLIQAIRSVRAKAVHAEMTTIGGRTKNVVVIQWDTKEEVGALERALKAVIENRAFMDPWMGRVVVGQKRARDCYGSFVEVD